MCIEELWTELETGGSADRQRLIFRETHSLEAVARAPEHELRGATCPETNPTALLGGTSPSESIRAGPRLAGFLRRGPS